MNGNERHLRNVVLHQTPSELELDMQRQREIAGRARHRSQTRIALGLVAGILTVGTVVAVLHSTPVGSRLGLDDPAAKVERRFDSTTFKPDKDAKPELMVTQNYGGHEILLRNDAELSDNNIIGIVKPGLVVVVIRGTGNVYASMGDETTDEGKKRGIWDQIVGEVQVYDKVGSEYFPRVDKDGKPVVAKDAIVAGHFLGSLPQKGESLAGSNPTP